MKKITPLFLFIALLLLSCNKHVQDVAGPDKVDQLFTQLKSEPTFLSYLNSTNELMKIIQKNVENAAPKDSAIMRDKSLTYKEKSEKLNFTGIEEMKVISRRKSEILKTLVTRYPVMATLTNDESKVLYKKAYAFYFPTSKK
ncbi:MAG: hypothetical protein ABIO05_08375 [Ferruginibacter sp.]